MKKSIYFFIRWAIAPLLFLICSYSYAQQPNAQVKISNDTLLDAKNYQFDVYVRAKTINGTTSFNLKGFQFAVQDSLKNVMNGGTVTTTVVAGSSNFGTNPNQQPTTILFKPSTTSPLYAQINPVALQTVGMTIYDSATDPLAASGWIRACSMKLTSTANFTQGKMYVFHSKSTTYPTVVQANYTNPNPANGVIPFDTLRSNWSNPYLNKALTLFNVTGTGSYIGTAGVNVGLDGSEVGCAYILQKNGTTISNLQEIVGTGGPISWPGQLAGTYTILGRRIATYINNVIMTGSATVTVASNTPGNAGTITGTFTVCQGQSNVTYNINKILYSDTTIWGYTGTGATIIRVNDTTIKVNYGIGATAGTLSVYGHNSLGDGLSSTQLITVNLLPATAGIITGIASVFPLDINTYIVPTINNATTYTWNYTGQGVNYTTSTSGDSVVLNFLANATSGVLTVKGTNACGDGVISQNFTINVSSIPAAAGTIVGSSSSCPGVNNLVYSVPPILGAASDSTGYVWNYSGTGATLKRSITGDTVYVNLDLSATSGNLTVNGHNSFGNGATSANYAITITPFPSAAGTIIGSNAPCINLATTYTVPSIANATSYVWTKSSNANGASNADTISINFTSIGAGTITVKGHNQCGDGPSSTAFAFTAKTVPTISADTLKGTTLVCQGSTNVLYYLSSTIPGSTNYVWTLPTGIVPTTGTTTTTNDSIKVTFTNATGANGLIKVKGSNACGFSSDFPLSVTINLLPAAAGTITGLTTVCQGDSVVYKVNPIANAITYNWTSPTGSTLTQFASKDSIKVKYTITAVNGNITVNTSNTCGTGTGSTLAVIVNPLPSVAGAITGAAYVCLNQNSVTYWVHKAANATSYVWTLPTGITGTSTDTTITVNVSASAVSGTISVKPTNNCGSATASTFSVTVGTLPGAAGTITGATTACGGATGVLYTVPTITNATSYSWTLPSGAVGSSSSNTIFVNYTSNTQSGNITVAGTSFCGNGTSSSLAIVVSQAPTFVFPDTVVYSKPNLTGDTALCPLSSNIVFYTHPIPGATSYSWSLPFGWTSTGCTTCDSIHVSLPQGSITGNISVAGVNTCGTGVSKYRKVYVSALPSLSPTIQGMVSKCVGDTAVFWISSRITNALSSTWTVPSGVTITSQNDSVIKVLITASAVSGYVSVTGVNFCGNGPVNQKYLTIMAPPVAAGTITGNPVACLGALNIFGVPQITGATSYAWSYTGVVDSLKPVNNQAYLYHGSTSTSGSLTVHGVNSCGSGPNSAPFVITTTTRPSATGTITGPSAVCQGANNQSYCVSAIPSATYYNWDVPTSLGTISGTSTGTCINVNILPLALAGTITVKAGNDCGLALIPSASIAVTINSLPSAAGVITGLSTTVCTGVTGLQYSVPTISGASSYLWSYTPATAFTGSSTTNAITLAAGNTAGAVTLSVKGHNSCGDGAAYNLPMTILSAPAQPTIVDMNPTTLPRPANTKYYRATPFDAGSTYTWTLTPNNTVLYTLIPYVTTDTISLNFNKDSNYCTTLTVKAQNQCGSSVSSTGSQICVVGINEWVNNLNYHIYPNPTHGLLNIEMNGINENLELAIINIQGEIIKTESISRTSSIFKKEIDLSAYSRGIYFVKIIGKEFVKVEKIVVQ